MTSMIGILICLQNTINMPAKKIFFFVCKNDNMGDIIVFARKKKFFSYSLIINVG